MVFKYSVAELKAIKVLEECGLSDPTEIPIGTVILGRKAFYEEIPLENKEGKIVSVGGKSIITINSNIAFESKRRFAAAHELGHYEMHRNLKPIFTDTDEQLMDWYKGGPHEMEANQFAAEYLMPSEMFYKECKGKKFDFRVIEYLATRFMVSKTAAILKFVKRGNHPVFIVYCKDNKMKWWEKSSDFYHFSKFSYNLHPPTGSVAYEIFTSGKNYYDDESKHDIWKSDWFEMKYDDEADSRFFEYCLYSKTYNYTISIIWEK